MSELQGLPTVVVEVDGHEYTITALGAKEGRVVQAKLATVLGPVAEALATQEKLNDRAIAAAAKAAISGLNPELFVYLTDCFAAKTQLRNGADEGGNPRWIPLARVFDIHFAQRLLSMDLWLWECIAFNFADFLGKAGATGLLDLAKRSLSKSQKGSTGSSGE